MKKFNSSQESFRNLLTDIKKTGGFNLCVGAGITYPLAPLWDQLIDRLILYIIRNNIKDKKMRESFIKSFKKNDLYEKALFIKKSLNDLEYKLLIKSELYENKSNFINSIDETLIPMIKDLCRTGQVKSIISINYDNYLESYLRNQAEGQPYPIITYTITDKWTKAESHKQNEIPFIYIHGNIKPDHSDYQLSTRDITLSLDDYFNLFNNPLIWQNFFPITFMSMFPTIFLGTSFRDINLYRLIHISSQGNDKTKSYTFKAFRTAKPNVEITLLNVKGINVVNCGHYKNNSNIDHRNSIRNALELLIENIKLNIKLTI